MTSEKLVRMANEIARNLKSQGDETAIAATAEHLTRFWTPGMRKTIAAHLEQGGSGMDLVAYKAVELLTNRPSSPVA